MIGWKKSHKSEVISQKDYVPSEERIKLFLEYGLIAFLVQQGRLANAMKSDARPEQLLMFADWIYKTYGGNKNGN